MKVYLPFYFTVLFLTLLTNIEAQKPEDTEVWDPEPPIIAPGYSYATAPSDAQLLFSENHLDQWSNMEGKKTEWTIEGDIFTVRPGSGNIRTLKEFQDFQLHIEWRPPLIVKGKGMGRGNSGVYLQGKYEVQILDSYENRIYSNGQAASIFKQTMPLVNAMHRTGKWNSYDIIYKAPRFTNDGILISPAYVTILHNGVLVQNHTEIMGSTVSIGNPSYEEHGSGPIVLQDHGDLVSFRNIWIREL